MDIEKSVSLNASAEKIWALLLDPQVMGACVPGMKSIEVISDTEYLAEMHVKFSFLSAKFKLRTEVVEQEAGYLHTTASSALFGFIDDVELYADTSHGQLQARSVSRLGDSDLGVNSRRLTALEEALNQRA